MMGKSPHRIILSTVLLAALACRGGADRDAGEGDEVEPAALVPVGESAGIAIDSALRERLGIRLTVLTRATTRPELELPAVVVVRSDGKRMPVGLYAGEPPAVIGLEPFLAACRKAAAR